LHFKTLPAIRRSNLYSNSHITASQGGRMAIPLPIVDPLAAIAIATPCNVPWSEMRGDYRSRFCGQCRKKVFDLSALTTSEATELLGDPHSQPCVRLYRRPDGRVMTSDCPAGFRARIWRRLRRRGAWIASLFAMLFLPACRTTTQGVISPDYSAAVFSGLPKNLETPTSETTTNTTSQSEQK
jgi:hypothetical protein